MNCATQPFDISRNEAGDSVAVVRCGRCNSSVDLNLRVRTAHPDWVVKELRRSGWRIHPGKSERHNRCPRCQRRGGNDPDELIRKLEAMPMTKPATTSPVPPDLREPTPEQRMKIRHMLDGYFDDTRGCYLDGYSDQKIGEELNLPWAMVTRIREAAYGSIRVHPGVEPLRKELADIRATLGTLEKNHEQAASALAATRKRLEDAEKRLAEIAGETP